MNENICFNKIRLNQIMRTCYRNKVIILVRAQLIFHLIKSGRNRYHFNKIPFKLRVPNQKKWEKKKNLVRPLEILMI